MNNRTLLPQNTYSYTIRQAYHNEKRTVLFLCFTIDTGQYKFRNVIEEFPTKEGFDIALIRLCQSLNFNPNGLASDINFPNQFIGLRALGKTEVIELGGAWVNKIKEYNLPKGQPEVDILKDKTDEHYYTNIKQKKLPIL